MRRRIIREGQQHNACTLISVAVINAIVTTPLKRIPEAVAAAHALAESFFVKLKNAIPTALESGDGMTEKEALTAFTVLQGIEPFNEPDEEQWAALVAGYRVAHQINVAAPPHSVIKIPYTATANTLWRKLEDARGSEHHLSDGDTEKFLTRNIELILKLYGDNYPKVASYWRDVTERQLTDRANPAPVSASNTKFESALRNLPENTGVLLIAGAHTISVTKKNGTYYWYNSKADEAAGSQTQLRRTNDVGEMARKLAADLKESAQGSVDICQWTPPGAVPILAGGPAASSSLSSSQAQAVDNDVVDRAKIDLTWSAETIRQWKAAFGDAIDDTNQDRDRAMVSTCVDLANYIDAIEAFYQSNGQLAVKIITIEQIQRLKHLREKAERHFNILQGAPLLKQLLLDTRVAEKLLLYNAQLRTVLQQPNYQSMLEQLNQLREQLVRAQTGPSSSETPSRVSQQLQPDIARLEQQLTELFVQAQSKPASQAAVASLTAMQADETTRKDDYQVKLDDAQITRRIRTRFGNRLSLSVNDLAEGINQLALLLADANPDATMAEIQELAAAKLLDAQFKVIQEAAQGIKLPDGESLSFDDTRAWLQNVHRLLDQAQLSPTVSSGQANVRVGALGVPQQSDPSAIFRPTAARGGLSKQKLSPQPQGRTLTLPGGKLPTFGQEAPRMGSIPEETDGQDPSNIDVVTGAFDASPVPDVISLKLIKPSEKKEEKLSRPKTTSIAVEEDSSQDEALQFLFGDEDDDNDDEGDYSDEEDDGLNVDDDNGGGVPLDTPIPPLVSDLTPAAMTLTAAAVPSNAYRESTGVSFLKRFRQNEAEGRQIYSKDEFVAGNSYGPISFKAVGSDKTKTEFYYEYDTGINRTLLDDLYSSSELNNMSTLPNNRNITRLPAPRAEVVKVESKAETLIASLEGNPTLSQFKLALALIGYEGQRISAEKGQTSFLSSAALISGTGFNDKKCEIEAKASAFQVAIRSGVLPLLAPADYTAVCLQLKTTLGSGYPKLMGQLSCLVDESKNLPEGHQIKTFVTEKYRDMMGMPRSLLSVATKPIEALSQHYHTEIDKLGKTASQPTLIRSDEERIAGLTFSGG